MSCRLVSEREGCAPFSERIDEKKPTEVGFFSDAGGESGNHIQPKKLIITWLYKFRWFAVPPDVPPAAPAIAGEC